MRSRLLLILIIVVSMVACSSGWSEAELGSVERYCSSSAGEFSSACQSWIDGILRLSDCDPDQAKQVIDRIIDEYGGVVPPSSIAENYERVGCSYGQR